MEKEMNKFDKQDELFRRYLDGELDSEEERKVLHLIADDEEMREVLRFERSVYLSFAEIQDPGSFTVPKNFSSSVMDRIEKSSPVSNTAEEKSRESAAIFSLFRNRKITINPALAAAAMVLLTFGFGYLLMNQQSDLINERSPANGQAQIQTISDNSENESKIWIRFVYFDESAESIEIAGDFNNWEPSELTRETMGDRQVWTGLVPVTRGEHKYMFVRNGGEWVTDPLAEVQQDDGFGNKNAVLYL